jgi:hypothetical protein
MKGIRQAAYLVSCFVLVFWTLSPSAFGQSAPDWQNLVSREALHDASIDTHYSQSGLGHAHEQAEGGNHLGFGEVVVRSGVTIGMHRAVTTAGYFFC